MGGIQWHCTVYNTKQNSTHSCQTLKTTENIIDDDPKYGRSESVWPVPYRR